MKAKPNHRERAQRAAPRFGLAPLLLLPLLGLACSLLTSGRSAASPTPIAILVTATPARAETPGAPSAAPSLTAVPPQSRTPGSPPAGGPPDGAIPGVPPAHAWPTPAALPEPLDAAERSPEQQAALERLQAARPPQRDDLELARLYSGWDGQAPPTPAAPVPLAAGAVQELKVFNHDRNTIETIVAELFAVSQHAYFWFDTGPGSVRPEQAELDAVTAAFDAIYAQSISLFGPERNPGVDGDPRLHIVNASPLILCDVSLETLQECGLAGYFSASDGVSTAVNPQSNAREMFVMNAAYFGADFYLNVLAHELRHMIEDNYDRGDADWVAEGGATLAEDLLGFSGSGLERANLFLTQPDQQLNRWTNGFTIPHYGQGYLLNRYLYDRLGPELYRQFGASPETGLAAVDAVAAANGLALIGMDLWLDWLAALAIHDHPAAAEPYRIQLAELNTASRVEIGGLPASFEEGVNQFAADYYHFEAGGPVELSFEAGRQAALLDAPAASGDHFWLATRHNYSHDRLTRALDLRQASQATLRYKVYHDIEAGYDFGYLFVSQDGGQSWQALPAANMQGEQAADDPSNSALADRFYTGRSETWREEQIDLSPYAGSEILIRFAYITDPILTFGGLALDDIAVPEIGFFDDAEGEAGGWQAEGFQRVTAAIPQAWHLQLITFPDGAPRVERLGVEGGRFSARLDPQGEALLIVAASAPQTLQPAAYRLSLSPAP
ncbi:MAG: hypothetical protein ACRDHL_15160 [Candidatus Promineifilaceae bacterium]